MANKIDLTKKDILHIAKLANLQIKDENIEMYRTQLAETLTYVENLDELETTNVEPTSHSTKLTSIYFDDGRINARQLTQDEALQNARNTKKKMFVVKRIMD